MTTISEIEQSFKNIFDKEKGLVQSVKTAYELSDNEEFYKLVISVHGLSMEDTTIIHTKFIFKTDLNKRNVTEDAFLYLYGINCIYHRIEFANVLDMEKKIKDIIGSNNFSEDLQILSDFCESPSTFLNHYMRKQKITDYSVFDVIYEPKFPISKCQNTTFDFEIDINNNYKIYLSIKKIEAQDPDGIDVYKFQFKFMDDTETIENNSLLNIHYFIGYNIARILDKKLKS